MKPGARSGAKAPCNNVLYCRPCKSYPAPLACAPLGEVRIVVLFSLCGRGGAPCWGIAAMPSCACVGVACHAAGWLSPHLKTSRVWRFAQPTKEALDSVRGARCRVKAAQELGAPLRHLLSQGVSVTLPKRNGHRHALDKQVYQSCVLPMHCLRSEAHPFLLTSASSIGSGASGYGK